MQDAEVLSLERIQAFLEASDEVQFKAKGRHEVYDWMTRLVGQYLKNSEVKEAVFRRNRFQSRFTQADIELLAKVDEAHETLSGPATRKILEREWEIYKHTGYERLANYTRTRAVQVAMASGASRNQEGSRDTCASIPCIRETGTGSKACITSTRSTR